MAAFYNGHMRRHQFRRRYDTVSVNWKQLVAEALEAAPDPTVTLVCLAEDMEPGEIATLRAALDAAIDQSRGQGGSGLPLPVTA